MEWKHIITAAIVGLCIGATAAWHIGQNKLAEKQNQIKSCLQREATFCDGQSVGAFRLTAVTCNNEQEICLCGNPQQVRGEK